MSTVQSLRTFANERLAAAVEEILGVFEKTIVVYEEEIDRQRRLLDIVLKPEIKLHRAEPPQPSVCKEELLLDQQHCKQERNSSLGREVPEPPQIKEEQEELCSSQDGEQPSVQEEADVCKLTPASEGSDHSEHESLHSDPDQTQSAAEEEAVANISFKLIRPEGDREDSGVSEPNSDKRLRSHNHHVAESEGYKTSSRGNTGSTRRTEPKQKNRPHKCDRCRKEFSDLTKLKTHQRTHTGKERFQCESCGEVFKNMCDLKKHTRTHMRETLYRCRICGKKFSCHSDYTRHVRIHTGQKRHSCALCGKEFIQSSSLKQHLRSHTGEKPYKCHLCGKGFAVNYVLKRHTRIHTGERPFECTTCGKVCSQLSNLKIHMRTHTGEKPFKCSTCGKAFALMSTLKKHLNTHTGAITT